MLLLLIRVCQEQFLIVFPWSLLAAYYATRAAIAEVPAENDDRKVLLLAGAALSGRPFDLERWRR